MHNPDSKFAFRRTWGPYLNYPNVLKYKPPTAQLNKFVVVAGPCAVENKDQIDSIAKIVRASRTTHLRGGIYRAGTFPGKRFGYVEQSLIEAYKDAAVNNGLKNIVEVLDYSNESLEKIEPYADCFQVGCRSMQNYKLLRMLGTFEKPVFLKRHPGTTLDEFLGAAEHLLVGGVTELYLIERGSSTHLNHVRWDLSISMIPAVQTITKIPVLCDASHGTGRRDLVVPMTLAGVAAGADGILVEVHTDPEHSFSDADQAINPETFKNLMLNVEKIRQIVKELK